MAPESSELLAALFATLLNSLLFWAEAYNAVNIIAPAMIGAIASWAMWRLVRRAPANVWTPLFALRAAVAAYLFIGALIPETAGDIARESIFALYAYSPEEGAKTHVICMAFYLTLLLSVKAASLVLPAIRYRVTHRTFDSHQTFILGLVFAGIGMGYLTLIEIPTRLAWYTVSLPGSIMIFFAAIGSIGVFLVTLWASEGSRARYILVLALLLTQLLLSAILLEKLGFLMAVLLAGLAMLIVKASVFRIALLALTLGAVLSLMDPAFAAARHAHIQIYGDLTGGTVDGRLDGFRQYFLDDRFNSVDGDDRYTFTRLNYTSSSSFVVTQYDQHMPGRTIRDGLFALVPRAIWPEKPHVSSIGFELYEMLTGRATSSLGIIVFTDAYWNFGWLGAMIFVPAGFFLWWASCIARRIVEARDWLMMPFVLIVFRIGLSVDNVFVLTWLTPAVLSVIFYHGLRIVNETLLSRRYARGKS
ncbi:MAG: hypothetical protein ACT4N8_14320 [Sphingosinicella sp.]|uniref:hypothetical protein n=1 Tax=Sphingosinicella sp. TaxID=1917971 RepID=UPI0040380384